MKQQENRCLATFDGVVLFGENHTITPEIPRVTALYAQVGTVADQMHAFAASQDDGKTTVFAGVDLREELTRELKELLKPINQVALSLDKTEHPTISAKFRMPRSGRYEDIISRARAFVAALGDAAVKSIFSDRGLAATIDTAITAKANVLAAAVDVKNEGAQLRMGSTAALKEVTKEGMKALRELDGILSQKYRNDPMLLAAWKGARRVERTRKKEASAPAPAAALAAPAPPPTAAPAPEPPLAPAPVDPVPVTA
jgi:hypothetical protein